MPRGRLRRGNPGRTADDDANLNLGKNRQATIGVRTQTLCHSIRLRLL
jgi:hypothetical protein